MDDRRNAILLKDRVHHTLLSFLQSMMIHLSLRWKTEIDLDPQSLSVIVIGDVECPKSPPVPQRIAHKIDRPAFVRRLRHA